MKEPQLSLIRNFIMIMVLVTSCTTNKKMTTQERKVPDLSNIESKAIMEKVPSPHVMLYKTKSDYSNLVPIILSSDKSQIVSYPHPGDLKINGIPQLPTAMHDGYYIDNRGINENAVFLKLTYEEYSKLDVLPTLQQLMDWILDKDPLVELYDCGQNQRNPELIEKINKLIDNKQIRSNLKVIKTLPAIK